GHDHDVSVCTSEHLALELLRCRRRNELDLAGSGDGEIRGDQGHVGPAEMRLLGQGYAHATGGAVAEESHRIERLACAAGADQHTFACELPTALDDRLDAPEDLLRLAHPPNPPLAFRHLTLIGTHEHDPSLA